MHRLKQTGTSFRLLYLLFSHYCLYKSSRGCNVRNPVKTAGYAMQELALLFLHTTTFFNQSVLRLHQICKPYLYRYLLSSSRSVQSVHLIQTFGLTLIGLRHKKISLRIKSGLQEMFSRISQPIYSRVASGTTSWPENCQELC